MPRHMKSIKIEVKARLHIGLISMHEAGIRKNGGIGFAVSDPTTTIVIKKCKRFSLFDHRETPLRTNEINVLKQLVEKTASSYQLDSNASISIMGELKTHVGMGSGTAIRLAVLEGICKLNDREIDRSSLVAASGRGGTSGIGINTYFKGGLILDLGVPHDGTPFRPSSTSGRGKLPLSLPSVPMPQWSICLVLPRALTPKTQSEEIEFFQKSTPIKSVSSYEAGYYSLFGIYASAVEANLESFCQSVNYLQSTEWKRKEWLGFGKELEQIASSLRDFGAPCVGMSSLGPLLYCVGADSVIDQVVSRAQSIDCLVLPVRPSNMGRVVST